MRTCVRSVSVLLLLCACVMFVGTARASSIHDASLLPGITGGYAYADNQDTPIGNTNTRSSPLYLVSLGCALSNKTVTASAVSTQPGVLTSSGPIVDSVTTSRTPTIATVQASADVHNVNVLGGLITATRANAVAASAAMATAVSSSDMTTFVGLQVAGLPVLFNPAPNTTLSLPGVGSVTLNELSTQTSGANFTMIVVTAIDIKVTVPNLLGLPVGTQIGIASAATSFTRTAKLASVGAHSFGWYSSSGAMLASATSGPWALAAIGCVGGSSQSNLNNANLPINSRSGTMTDTAAGQILASSASAQSISEVHNMNLLGQMITADSLTSNSLISPSGVTSAVVTLINAKVNGVPLQRNPRPNTMIPITGLGYIIVNEQSIISTPTQVVVQANAFDLHVTTANSLGLPVGTDVIVGHSDASVANA